MSSRDELLQHFEDTMKACHKIMVAKNHDYAGKDSQDVLANFRSAKVINIDVGKGILLRVLDKIKRLETFIDAGELKVKGEGAQDAIQDVINYMILLGFYFNED